MQVSKSSLHYRWMEWVYGWYSYDPVPKNLCPYFWKLLFSPIPFLLSLCMYVFSLCISFVLSLFWWIVGYRPSFDFADVKNPNFNNGPVNMFECGDYKTGLYGKDRWAKSPVAPWEILLVLCAVILMFTAVKMSLIILAVGVGVWFLILGGMRGGKLVGPFFRSVKEKHCKKLEFVD